MSVWWLILVNLFFNLIIDIVRGDADHFAASANVAGHVNLHHGDDIATILIVLLCNRLAAQETALLGAVPVKLYRALRSKPILNQAPECLEDSDGATAIILKEK